MRKVGCNTPGRTCLYAVDDDDDEDDGPLGKGIASVSWLPTVINAKSPQDRDDP
jgi:hypothetical protein